MRGFWPPTDYTEYPHSHPTQRQNYTHQVALLSVFSNSIYRIIVRAAYIYKNYKLAASKQILLGRLQFKCDGTR